MKPSLAGSKRISILVTILLAAFSPRARAEKIWTNNVSGLWSDSQNWSGHSPPDITSFIRITNDLSKTITINSLTSPTNLTVQKLTLSAPPGAVNTLLLSDAGLANPLVFQTGLEMVDGSAIRITNSALQTLLTNDHVNIDGSLTLDSGWIDFGDTTVTARVGRVTSGSFNLNGGTVYAGAMTVGGLTNSSGFLKVNGGVLNISSFLSVGRSLGTTGAAMVVGGFLNVTNDDTRIGDDGVGQMVISNAAALLNNLQVGRDNAGTLTLQPGSAVQVLLDTVIGRFATSTGTINVSGGQFLAPGQRIFIGRGGNGQLMLSAGSVQSASALVAADTTNSVGSTGNLTASGGTLMLSSNLLVGSASFSTGSVWVAGGNFVITNSAKSAVLAVGSGVLTLTSGTIATDALVVTGAASRFSFSSGTLSAKRTSVNNGVPFVVGDGSASATLHLDGGTHSFANGLVISSNATLEGCGTVIGSIVNYGTIATNCGGTITIPSVTTPPQDQAVVLGSNVTFTVVAAGSPPLSFQWHFQGTNLAGATTSAFTRVGAQLADEGSYSVVITNSGGSVTSSPAILTVLVPPTITVPPQNQTVVAGTNATFNVVATGSQPLFYQWRFNGTDLAGATRSSFTRSGVQTADGGTYSVVVTNATAYGASAAATLTVLASAAPVTITLQVPENGSSLISFPSVSGSTYTLQFKDLLSDPGWISLPPSTNGTGAQILLRDPAPNPAARFYRVQTQ